MRRPIVAVVVTTVAAVTLGAMPAGAGEPTCAGVGALQNHGQHIVGDYVTGTGGIAGTMTWPPAGAVGSAVGGEGAMHPGAPGRWGHGGFAPGASFCTGSQSPGAHL